VTRQDATCGAVCADHHAWTCKRQRGHGGRHESADGGDWWDEAPAVRGRSGTPWTEDQRAARGRGRMTLRMTAEAHEMLAELADDAGCSASERVEELVREARRKTPAT
jgi:hypothetical protein